MSGHDPGQLDRNEKRTLLPGLRSVNDWGAPEKWSVSALFMKRGNRHIRGWAELATHCTLGGSVATADVDRAKTRRERCLCSYAEQGSNEVALSAHVIRWCTYDLSLADHRHRLIACDRLVGRDEALEA
jgi:hypothetical protein